MHGNPTVSQPDVGPALEQLIDICKLGYETATEDGELLRAPMGTDSVIDQRNVLLIRRWLN